ncbi:histone H3K4me/H3K4me2/H3K4me3 demethylase [Malassezia pachydermatis]
MSAIAEGMAPCEAPHLSAHVKEEPQKPIVPLPIIAAGATRPPVRSPEHISCCNLGRFADGVAELRMHMEETKRGERRSKTQALSAMGKGNEDASSSNLSPPPHASRHATRKAGRMPPLPPLVFDTTPGASISKGHPPPIATGASTPRYPEPRTRPRFFGLEEAPTFYPTWDEFQDPLKYIQWVARPDGGNGAACGIAKIVPPSGWQMDCVVDEQTFRFRTRVQRLNELSAERRVSQNYTDQLEQFHVQQGHGRLHIPRLSQSPVDLYALKRCVEAAERPVDWDAIAQWLGYDLSLVPKASSVLASAYTQLVAPFEAFLRAASTGLSMSPSTNGSTAALKDTTNITKACATCQREAASVQCIDCERAFHLSCVSPPLSEPPRDDWVCPACLLQTGADFGFEDGETHSLYSFWQRCGAFEALWAERAAKQGASQWRDRASLSVHEREDLIEAEFWRLVHSRHELVDVEYGADVHSTTHGHASPTMECQPLNVYSRSGWNLNNMPILSESLLRYIRSEISGMTVPWIYLGMLFSAFCWHNEDHYTYSINYQHWGAPKTWYGVPGADAEKFEAAMRKIAPELFASCPDLLLQLVTMMSPALAQQEGVRVYACNQRANEFVVTFPKAYHSGFNQGFNLNEAVNFALPDWVMQGLECVQRYQEHARQPVFSHDELLVTIALHNQHLSTALWLQPAFDDMVTRELAAREQVRTQILHARASRGAMEEAYDTDGEVPCAHCKTLCYLSHVVSADRSHTVASCLAHAAQVHGAAPGAWLLRVRHDDAFLKLHAHRLHERASVPVAWQQRVRKLLEQHPRPPIRTLRMLVQEGEKIHFPLPELEQLRAFLVRAEPWIVQAQAFLSRRQAKPAKVGRRTKRARSSTPPTPSMEDTNADTKRTPDALLALQARIPTLPFEAPELQAIDGVVEQMNTFCEQASAFLELHCEVREAVQRVDEAERTLGQGELLQVDLPQVKALRRWIAHVRWFSEVHGIGTGFLSYEEVQELLTEAQACDVPVSHPCRQDLLARAQAGEVWQHKAQSLLDEAPSITQGDLQALLDVPAHVATPSELRARVHSLEHKAAQWHDTLTRVHEATQPSHGRGPPTETAAKADDEPLFLAETRRVLYEAQAARLDLPLASELANAVALHDQWNAELHQILQYRTGAAAKAPVPLDEVDIPAARAFCERTIRTASADAVNRQARDAPSYDTLWTYPPVPYPPKHSTEAPCLCMDPHMDRAASVACAGCATVYHLRCLERKSKPPKSWRCAFCDDTQLPSWLASRRAVSQLPLVALFQNKAFQWDQFRFVPSNYARLQAAVRATVEFGVAVSMQFRQGALPASLLDPVQPTHPAAPPSAQLRHIARRAFACPINVLLIGDATPQAHVPSVLDVCLPAFHIQPSKPTSLKKKRAPRSTDASSRRRAKRARLLFMEEQILASAPAETNVYCYCRRPDNGTMVQCDRCSHWFHSACMCIDDPSGLQEKWFCPCCCFRLRTRYPWAEVKIRDATRHLDVPPDVFVDVPASLKSETEPVLKRQAWMTNKRIILTLSGFEPAVPAPDVDVESATPAPPSDRPDKRARTASPSPLLTPADEACHRAGQANLLRRGVSEAMMRAYPMGWDGESIVCHVAPDRHIVLGPSIVLAADDPDGSRLVRMALEGLVPWAHVRTSSAWPPASTPAPGPLIPRPDRQATPQGGPHVSLPTLPPPSSTPFPRPMLQASHGSGWLEIDASMPMPRPSLPPLHQIDQDRAALSLPSSHPLPASTEAWSAPPSRQGDLPPLRTSPP